MGKQNRKEHRITEMEFMATWLLSPFSEVQILLGSNEGLLTTPQYCGWHCSGGKPQLFHGQTCPLDSLVGTN